MPDTSVLPSVDQLFLKWKQFLDDGALTTATFVAGEFPELIDPLQLLINSYIAQRADGVEETLTAALLVESRKPETTPVLPGYTILGPLGEGGMGIVYRVRDPLEREWALKLARHGQLNEAGRERFHDEAKAMDRLHHPNVAPIHHFDFTSNGRPFFLMPIYPGNLTSRLNEYQADPVKAVKLMTAVAEGVGHLHAQGFVHRDLKPHNILMKEDGQPAVSDFGLVKSLSELAAEVQPDSASGRGSGETKPSGAKKSRTMAGAAVGTRAYMAPEQAAGLTHLSNPKWDVWALGVILHELVTGRRPPSSDAPQKLLDPKHADNPPPSIIKPGLDPRMEKIIQRCLARTEKDRYADGQEVARALRAWRPVRQAPRREKWVVLIGVVLIGLLLGRWAIGKWLDDRSGVVNPAPARQHAPPPNPLPDELVDESVFEIIRDGRAVKPHTWRFGEEDGTLRINEANKPLTLFTNFNAVVEYLPAAERDTVRVAAKVRLNSGTPKTGMVGVYVGGTTVQTAKGQHQAIIEVSFTDTIDNRSGSFRTGMVRLTARLLNSAADQSPSPAFVHLGELIISTPKSGVNEPFHYLTLELTQDWVRAWFDDQFVAGRERQYVNQGLMETAELGMGSVFPIPIEFLPSGGAGLYVADANASYERFRVHPAPQQPPE